jgi:hypothetical protein
MAESGVKVSGSCEEDNGMQCFFKHLGFLGSLFGNFLPIRILKLTFYVKHEYMYM